MAYYQTLNETVGSLKNKMTLPKFQRGYVWGKQKKLELIKTLHGGFPMGMLLTQVKPNQKQSLLDGQQRWSTIMDFDKNRANYWKALEPDEYQAGFDLLKEWLVNGKELTEKKYDEGLSSEDPADWVDDLMIELEWIPEITSRDVRNLFKENRKKIDKYLDIDSVSIPVIQYSGPEKHTAQVFENLNKGGVQLTKFEIFAAAWSDANITLERTPFQNEILEYVKKYYLDKQDDAERYDLDLDGFSEDELSETRKINLFELGLAIGAFAQKRLGTLIPRGDKSKVHNEIGFGILGIFSDVDPRALSELKEKQSKIEDELEDILDNVDSISTKLEMIFQKLIADHTNNGGYSRSLSTTFKTLSYFAALWDIDDEQTRKSVLNNIPAYYVFDAVKKTWGNAGDSRLYDYYSSAEENPRSYVEPVNPDAFKMAFQSWLTNENTQPERFMGAVKSLATIHANLTYLSDKVEFGEQLQFEHIYPKARVREFDTGRMVILGSLGNVMYLPKTLNQSKKTRTLYELEDSTYPEVIEGSCYPTEADFELAFSELEKNNFGTLNELIRKRADVVSNEIVDKLLNKKFD